MRAHGGLGLGLAIVDYLVRQQCGVVCAQSEGIGRGSTFIVEFPLMPSEVLSSSEAAPGRTDEISTVHIETDHDQKLKGRRILLVEDDADTQDLLKTVLGRHGADVIAADSGARALSELRQGKPDVIISDIAMVGENGYDLIRKIRSMPPEEGGHIPAIALTAYAGTSDRRRALLAGFQTHLAKPVEPDDLVAVVLSLTYQQETCSEEEKESKVNN